MTWTARNGGMLRGRWRTNWVCDTCGHMVRDDHPDWKWQKKQHDRGHAGQPDLFDEEQRA